MFGEQRFGELDAALERSTQALGRSFGAGAKTGGSDRLADETERERSELGYVLRPAFALSTEQHLEDLLEIVRMRAGQHGGSEPRRLERILSAMLDQTAAEKGEFRGAIKKSQLTQRVGDVDFGARFGQRARAAALDRKAARERQAFDLRTARGMARRDDGERVRVRRAQ